MFHLKEFYCKLRYVIEKKYRQHLPLLTHTVTVSENGKPPFIAHRGLSGLETENTRAAFIEAGKRSYFGIETDVHRTKDGAFVTFHDDTLKRLAGIDRDVEQMTLEELKKVTLNSTRLYAPKGDSTDLSIPTLADYIGICKQFDKKAVLELKNHFEKADIFRICDEIEAMGYKENMIFISFDFENLVFVREKWADAEVQFLTGEVDDPLIAKLKQYRFDLDAYHVALSKTIIQKCHQAGIQVNAWTVDEKKCAKRLIRAGVDFITTDILE